jgi:hypothetical protein
LIELVETGLVFINVEKVPSPGEIQGQIIESANARRNFHEFSNTIHTEKTNVIL